MLGDYVRRECKNAAPPPTPSKTGETDRERERDLEMGGNMRMTGDEEGGREECELGSFRTTSSPVEPV